jgi:WD40 repeat protein
MAYSPQGDRLVSADARNVLMLWDMESRTVIRQRALDDDALSVLHWTEQGIFAGSKQGNLILFTENFNVTAFPAMDTEITALTVAPSGYILAGAVDGKVCVFGTVAP